MVIKGHLDTLPLAKMPHDASLGADTGARESGLILERGRRWELTRHQAVRGYLNLDPRSPRPPS